MRATRLILVAAVALGMGASAAVAQSAPQYKLLDATRWDLSLGYSNMRANAPPGQCQCFDLNGGFIFGSFHVTDWFRIAGEFSGSHGGNISSLGQGLTLTTFTGGPQVSHRFGRFTPYGEALVGGAHGGDSYFPSHNAASTSASSFAFSTGGGLDYRLTPRFAIRAFDVQYLRTSFPNGVNNQQNHLMMGAGLVIRFYGRQKKIAPPPPVQAEAPPPPPPPPPTPPPVISFVCAANVTNIPLGQLIVITADAKTMPGGLEVAYQWTTTGGAIQGTGQVVSIDTTNMTIGDFQVRGHASLVSDSSIGADCIAPFRIIPAVPAPAAVESVSDFEKREKEFHENVKDAFFAVNSAKISPDTLATVIHAAQYLVAHPKIQVIISGWTDTRGSADFNLALGIKRANAVRNALVEAGVPPGQLEVISNGKSSQVCATRDAKCLAQNRRVSYSMKP
jgi:outer membrane protein OmpA-like peptidoglycan-associated protein/opacity protein-like surface antigen